MNSSKQTVTIYTTPTCGYCKMAKKWLDSHKISYKEIDVSSDEHAKDEMTQRSGEIGVPQILIGKKVIVGFDEEALEKALLKK